MRMRMGMRMRMRMGMRMWLPSAPVATCPKNLCGRQTAAYVDTIKKTF